MKKKIKHDTILHCLMFLAMYIVPLITYLTNDNFTANIYTFVLVINPIFILLCSLIYARYDEKFYVFPMIWSCLFIPLCFYLYPSNYLLCVFLYIFCGILGGLIGLWFHNNKEAVKSLKKAIGIISIVASIFIFIFNIFSVIIQNSQTTFDYVDMVYDFTIGSLSLYLCIFILILLSIRCLKKKD